MKNIKQYLLSKPFSTESFPFGEGVSVFKVNNKLFALLSLGKPDQQQADKPAYWWLNLKCDPQEAVMLRDIFPAIIPGYHTQLTDISKLQARCIIYYPTSETGDKIIGVKIKLLPFIITFGLKFNFISDTIHSIRST